MIEDGYEGEILDAELQNWAKLNREDFEDD